MTERNNTRSLSAKGRAASSKQTHPPQSVECPASPLQQALETTQLEQKAASRPAKSKSGRCMDAKQMLRAATQDAVQLLIDTMLDPQVKLEIRLDCCKNIMDRVYGKSSQPIDTNTDQTITLVLGELEPFAG